MCDNLIVFTTEFYDQDIQNNMPIGEFGKCWLLNRLRLPSIQVLTHCNTGSLATAGYGTVLSIVRALHANETLTHIYCTETRPYNQGSRLTAYELQYERITATLITDSMAAFLFARQSVHALIIGADRVARNGDTANKIGTYQLAIVAKAHNVLVIVAAPSTTIDLTIKDGNCIEIEERDPLEMICVNGLLMNNGKPSTSITSVLTAPANMQVWNPSFDVTPARYIDVIVTERGVITKLADEQVFDIDTFFEQHPSSKV